MRQGLFNALREGSDRDLASHVDRWVHRYSTDSLARLIEAIPQADRLRALKLSGQELYEDTVDVTTLGDEQGAEAAEPAIPDSEEPVEPFRVVQASLPSSPSLSELRSWLPDHPLAS